jgi:hypothetical protein
MDALRLSILLTIIEIPVVHLGDNDFQVVEVIAVAEVKPLDEGQCCQLG